MLFSILLMHCIYGGPVYYRFRIGCHCRKVPGLFAKPFLLQIGINGGIAQLPTALAGACCIGFNLLTWNFACLLGVDSLGFGQLAQFVVAIWWSNIWWCRLVVHFGGAYWWCILVVHIFAYLKPSDWVICLVS